MRELAQLRELTQLIEALQVKIDVLEYLRQQKIFSFEVPSILSESTLVDNQTIFSEIQKRFQEALSTANEVEQITCIKALNEIYPVLRYEASKALLSNHSQDFSNEETLRIYLKHWLTTYGHPLVYAQKWNVLENFHKQLEPLFKSYFNYLSEILPQQPEVYRESIQIVECLEVQRRFSQAHSLYILIKKFFRDKPLYHDDFKIISDKQKRCNEYLQKKQVPMLPTFQTTWLTNRIFLQRLYLKAAERLRAESITEVQQFFSHEIETFLQEQLTKIEQSLGQAPCAWRMIGIGSTNQVSNSSLRITLLVADENYRSHPYFSCLIQNLDLSIKMLGDSLVLHIYTDILLLSDTIKSSSLPVGSLCWHWHCIFQSSTAAITFDPILFYIHEVREIEVDHTTMSLILLPVVRLTLQEYDDHHRKLFQQLESKNQVDRCLLLLRYLNFLERELYKQKKFFESKIDDAMVLQPIHQRIIDLIDEMVEQRHLIGGNFGRILQLAANHHDEDFRFTLLKKLLNERQRVTNVEFENWIQELSFYYDGSAELASIDQTFLNQKIEQWIGCDNLAQLMNDNAERYRAHQKNIAAVVFEYGLKDLFGEYKSIATMTRVDAKEFVNAITERAEELQRINPKVFWIIRIRLYTEWILQILQGGRDRDVLFKNNDANNMHSFLRNECVLMIETLHIFQATDIIDEIYCEENSHFSENHGYGNYPRCSSQTKHHELFHTVANNIFKQLQGISREKSSEKYYQLMSGYCGHTIYVSFKWLGKEWVGYIHNLENNKDKDTTYHRTEPQSDGVVYVYPYYLGSWSEDRLKPKLEQKRNLITDILKAPFLPPRNGGKKIALKLLYHPLGDEKIEQTDEILSQNHLFPWPAQSIDNCVAWNHNVDLDHRMRTRLLNLDNRTKVEFFEWIIVKEVQLLESKQHNVDRVEKFLLRSSVDAITALKNKYKRDFCMQDIHMPVLRSSGFSEESFSSIESIFQNSEHKKILLYGRKGCGKETIAKYLVWLWSNGRFPFLKFVIFIDVRELREEIKPSLMNILKSCYKEEEDLGGIIDGIERYIRNTLFILTNYDAIPNPTYRKFIETFIKNQNPFCFVTSCSNQNIDVEFDTVVENIGFLNEPKFSDSDTNDYINSFFTSREVLARSILQFLYQHDDLLSYFKIPPHLCAYAQNQKIYAYLTDNPLHFGWLPAWEVLQRNLNNVNHYLNLKKFHNIEKNDLEELFRIVSVFDRFLRISSLEREIFHPELKGKIARINELVTSSHKKLAHQKGKPHPEIDGLKSIINDLCIACRELIQLQVWVIQISAFPKKEYQFLEKTEMLSLQINTQQDLNGTEIDDYLTLQIKKLYGGYESGILLKKTYPDAHSNKRYRILVLRSIRDSKYSFEFLSNESLLRSENISIKVLFAFYNRRHWQTIEILVHKKEHTFYVQFYVHDPFIDKNNLDSVLLDKLKKYFLHQLSSFGFYLNLSESWSIREDYSTRLCAGDDASSGVVVVHDILKRTQGFTLTIYTPCQIGMEELRKKFMVNMHQYLSLSDRTLQNFLHRHLLINSSIADVHSSFPKSASFEEIDENFTFIEDVRKRLLFTEDEDKAINITVCDRKLDLDDLIINVTPFKNEIPAEDVPKESTTAYSQNNTNISANLITRIKKISRDDNEYRYVDHEDEYIDLSQLFNRPINNALPTKILITAGAGMGKSVLCKYLLAKNKIEEGQFGSEFKFRWIFLIDCNRIAREGDVYELKDLVFKYGGIADHLDLDDKSQEEKLWHDIANSRVLYIFDTFENMPEGAKRVFTKKLITSDRKQKENQENSPYVIVTSRPYAPGLEGFIKKFDVHLTLSGFTVSDIKRYAHVVCAKLTTDTFSPQSILSWFDNHQPVSYRAARVPIIVNIIFNSIYQKVYHQVFDASSLYADRIFTLSNLYEGIIKDFVRRLLKERLKERFDEDITYQSDENLLVKPKVSCCLSFFGKIAQASCFEQEGTLIIRKEWIEKIMQQRIFKTELDGNYVNHIGFHVPMSLGKQIRDGFEFIHAMLRDYLAARTMVDDLLKNKAPVSENLGFLSLLREHKFNPRAQYLWAFVAGILYNQENTDHLLTYFRLLQTECSDQLGFEQACLLVRCLEQANYCEHSDLIEHPDIVELKKWIKESILYLIFRRFNRMIECLKECPIVVEKINLFDLLLESYLDYRYHNDTKNTNIANTLKDIWHEKNYIANRIDERIHHEHNIVRQQLLLDLLQQLDVSTENIQTIIETRSTQFQEEFIINKIVRVSGQKLGFLAPAKVDVLLKPLTPDATPALMVDTLEKLSNCNVKSTVISRAIQPYCQHADLDVRVAAIQVIQKIGLKDEFLMRTIAEQLVKERNERVFESVLLYLKRLLDLNYIKFYFVKDVWSPEFLIGKCRVVKTKIKSYIINLVGCYENSVPIVLPFLEEYLSCDDNVLRIAALDALLKLGVCTQLIVDKLLSYLHRLHFEKDTEEITKILKLLSFTISIKEFSLSRFLHGYLLSVIDQNNLSNFKYTQIAIEIIKTLHRLNLFDEEIEEIIMGLLEDSHVPDTFKNQLIGFIDDKKIPIGGKLICLLNVNLSLSIKQTLVKAIVKISEGTEQLIDGFLSLLSHPDTNDQLTVDILSSLSTLDFSTVSDEKLYSFMSYFLNMQLNTHHKDIKDKIDVLMRKLLTQSAITKKVLDYLQSREDKLYPRLLLKTMEFQQLLCVARVKPDLFDKQMLKCFIQKALSECLVVYLFEDNLCIHTNKNLEKLRVSSFSGIRINEVQHLISEYIFEMHSRFMAWGNFSALLKRYCDIVISMGLTTRKYLINSKDSYARNVLYLAAYKGDEKMQLLMRTQLMQLPTDHDHSDDLVQQYVGEGDRYMYENEFQKAIVCYESAIQLNPRFINTYTRLMNVYIAVGRYADVEKKYEEFSEQARKIDAVGSLVVYDEAIRFRANALRYSGEIEKALEIYNAALALISGDQSQKSNLLVDQALALAEKGDCSKALSVLQKATQSDLEVKFFKIYILSRMGRFEEASTNYNNALTEHTGECSANVHWVNMKAVMEFEAGNYDVALADLDYALSICKEPTCTMNKVHVLVELYHLKKRGEETSAREFLKQANDLFGEVIKINSERPGSKMLQAILHGMNGNLVDFEMSFNRLLERFPYDMGIRYYFAETYYYLGNIEEAKRQLGQIPSSYEYFKVNQLREKLSSHVHADIAVLARSLTEAIGSAAPVVSGVTTDDALENSSDSIEALLH